MKQFWQEKLRRSKHKPEMAPDSSSMEDAKKGFGNGVGLQGSVLQ